MFGSCEEEKYVNEETNTTFVDGDVCDPLVFRFGKQEMVKKKVFQENVNLSWSQVCG